MLSFFFNICFVIQFLILIMRPHTSIRNAKKGLNSEHGPIVQEQNEINKARPQYLNLSTESHLVGPFQ